MIALCEQKRKYFANMSRPLTAVNRNFGIAERTRLHVMLEAFNGLNKVNLGTPNRFANTAQFGTITESSTLGRQIQTERAAGILRGGEIRRRAAGHARKPNRFLLAIMSR